MIYRTRHVTTYSYAEPVQVSHHLAHLTPRPTPHQVSHRHLLTIEPEPSVLHRSRTDYFGNNVTFFTIQEPHDTLTVEATATVTVMPPSIIDAAATPAWEDVRDGLGRKGQALDAYEFVFDSGMITRHDSFSAYARPSFPAGRPILEGVQDLTSRIHADFTYDPQATTIATPLAQVMEERRGVCQDFAHLQIACLRSLGLAARYVSGYLLTLPPDGQEKLVGSDASHAWVSVFVPGQEWVDCDPTNDMLVGEEHITLAWGRDFEDVSPIKGIVLGGGEQTISVAVDVTPQPVQPAARPVAGA